MDDKGLTTISLKRINRAKVYQYIYKEKATSKLQIVQALQMGLSTVSQNLSLLEDEGLIERNGYFDSTGGRKAHAIRIVPDFKIAIGIGILKNMFHITAVDLYGNTMYTNTISLPYSNSPSYYEQVAAEIKDCIAKEQYEEERILGISIATQGITSPDHTTVTYGTIMHNTGMCLEHFSKYLPYPCHLEHDSKSAAFLELWNHPELDSAVVLLLNRNMGGSIITNHQIHQGNSMHSGTIEHMCINPDGPLCYCGNRGCLETYCSVNALEHSAGLPIKEFFPALREKKIPPAYTNLGRLSKPSGICHKKFKPGNRCACYYQRLPGTLFYRRGYRLSAKPYYFLLSLFRIERPNTGWGARTVYARHRRFFILYRTISAVRLTAFLLLPVRRCKAQKSLVKSLQSLQPISLSPAVLRNILPVLISALPQYFLCRLWQSEIPPEYS